MHYESKLAYACEEGQVEEVRKLLQDPQIIIKIPPNDVLYTSFYCH